MKKCWEEFYAKAGRIPLRLTRRGGAHEPKRGVAHEAQQGATHGTKRGGEHETQRDAPRKAEQKKSRARRWGKPRESGTERERRKKGRGALCGDTARMEQHYRKLYGDGNHGDKISRMKKKAAKRYGLLALLGVVLIAAVFIEEKTRPDRGIVIDGARMVSINRPSAEEGPIRIPARITVETAAEEERALAKNLTLIIHPEAVEEAEAPSDEEAEEDGIRLDEELEKLVKMINHSDAGRVVLLPVELLEGIRLQWEAVEKSNFPLAIAGLLCAFFLLYGHRHQALKKEKKEARDSVIRELPGFINQMVLLLNAGLVLTAAFSKIVSESHGAGGEPSYFYQQLLRIERNMRETNSPFTAEFEDFARRSGVKELMRLSGIMAGNVDKGADLVDKLQSECELLWFTKKKAAEEKGRLAETKMTFPLMLLLLVLIMITVTPALMEM